MILIGIERVARQRTVVELWPVGIHACSLDNLYPLALFTTRVGGYANPLENASINAPEGACGTACTEGKTTGL
jgi:hypothetical protein